MKRIVKFRDAERLLSKSDCLDCTQEVFDRSVTKHIRTDLRFDNSTGVVRDDHLGELSRPSNPRDFTPHADVSEVLHWEFKPHVNNSISRINRGLTA